MSKVFQAVSGPGASDSYIEEILGAPVTSAFQFEFDLTIPQATLNTLAAASQVFSADMVEVFSSSGTIDGLFLNFSGGAWKWWTDHTPGGPFSAVTGDTTYHVTMTYDFTTHLVTWKIDGVTITSFSRVKADLDGFDLGSLNSSTAGETYLYDNVLLTVGGVTVFSDDFESGTFAAWTSTTGDVSIISSGDTLTASFTGTPLSGNAPLAVTFTDHSTPGPSGPITGWSWDFGDGATSTLQNPSHTYTSPGTYTVSLTITSLDGTSSLTETGYITVFFPGGTDCADAATLTGCSSATIDNSGAPTTPPASDPLNTAYGLGTLERQLWFKYTNGGGTAAYLRFTFHNPTGANYDFAAGVFIDCPATDLLITAPDPNHRLDPASSDYFYTQDTITHGTDAFPTVGVLLYPGETAYLEIAGDDSGGHGWNGLMLLSWALLVTPTYDTTDIATLASGGQSDAVPTATILDTSGFETQPVLPGGLPPDIAGISLPLGYGHFDDRHFIACFSDTSRDINLSGTACDGSYFDQNELGVWEVDDLGAVIAFHSVYKFQHVAGSGLGFWFDTGEFALDSGAGSSVTFHTDGTTLWMVVAARMQQPNPYDTSLIPHQWVPGCALVFVYTGGAFSPIGIVPALTSNDSNLDYTLDRKSLPSTGHQFGVIDASASAAEPGVLHVITSESGLKDQPKSTGDIHGCQTDPTAYGDLTGGADWWARGTQLATFDAAGRTSLTLLAYDEQPLPFAVPSTPGVQESFTRAAWVRNDVGTPFWAWLRPRVDGTEGYEFALDIYSIAGSLIVTIGHALIDPLFGTTPTTITDAWLSRNAAVDPFDGRTCYLLVIRTNQGEATFRLDVADLANPRYVDDDTTITGDPGVAPAFTPTIGNSLSGAVRFDAKGIWATIGGGASQVAHYVRCFHDWLQPFLSYGETGGHPYPNLSEWTWDALLVGDYIWYGGSFNSNSTVDHPALCRTHIFRDWEICSVGDCQQGLHIWQRLHHNSRPSP